MTGYTIPLSKIFTDVQSNAHLRAHGIGTGTVPAVKTTTRPNGETPTWEAAPFIRTQNRNPAVRVTGKTAMRGKNLGGPTYYH